MLINDVQVYLVILRPLTIFYFPVFFYRLCRRYNTVVG